MKGWAKLMWPPAIVMSVAGPAYATEYLSIEEAQKLAFPEAVRFDEANIIYKSSDVAGIESLSGQKVRTQGEQIWRAQSAGRLLGWFIVDYVIGKHLAIDYAVALDPDGRVLMVEILNYRESYGGEIANKDWLQQFVGKKPGDPVELGQDVTSISGATLSSEHLAEGIRRVLAIYSTCLK